VVAIQGAVSTILAAILASGLYFSGVGRTDDTFDREGVALVRTLMSARTAGQVDRAWMAHLAAPDDVLAVTIDGTIVAADPTDMRMTSTHGRRLIANKSVDVISGNYRGVAARRFAVTGTGAGELPQASVILSEEKVSKAKGGLLSTATLLGLLVVAIGVAGAYTMVLRLLSPIRQLTAEMKSAVAGRNRKSVAIHASGELGRLAEAVQEVARGLDHGRVIREEREEVGRELEMGAEVQSSLLPDRIPMIPGMDIGAFCRPLTEVGGDYYDFLELSEGRLGMGIFDVSGHGVPGAIVMAMVKALLHEVAPTAAGPADTLRRLNAALHSHLARGLFITGIYAEFDIATRTVRLANAGHNPALIHRSSTRRMEQLRPGGPALGLAEAARFDGALREGELTLDLGDRVVLYTDGAVEIKNARGEEFGEEKFHRLVAKEASRESNAFVNLVIDELETFRGDAPPEDDLTIITFGMTV